ICCRRAWSVRRDKTRSSTRPWHRIQILSRRSGSCCRRVACQTWRSTRFPSFRALQGSGRKRRSKDSPGHGPGLGRKQPRKKKVRETEGRNERQRARNLLANCLQLVACFRLSLVLLWRAYVPGSTLTRKGGRAILCGIFSITNHALWRLPWIPHKLCSRCLTKPTRKRPGMGQISNNPSRGCPQSKQPGTPDRGGTTSGK